MTKFYNAPVRAIQDQMAAEWEREIAAGIASLGANELRERYLEAFGATETDPSGATWPPISFMYEAVCLVWNVEPN